jgi:hypothetical protein
MDIWESSGGMADDTAFFVYDKQSNKFCYKEVEDIQNMMDWSSTVLVKADVWRDYEFSPMTNTTMAVLLLVNMS